MLTGEEAAKLTFALGPGEGEAWWWMSGLATIKATGEQTDGRYSLVEILVPEFPKEEGLLHLHHFEDEGFYVLEGEMTFYVGERTIKARPGTFLFGPKEVPHAYHRRVGAGEAVVRPLARGHGGSNQGDGGAGKVADRFAPAGGAARRGRDGAAHGHRRPVWGEMLGPPPSQ